MNVEFLRRETMHFLRDCRGKEKAIPRAELLHHLQLFEERMTDRRMRDIYAELPIAACAEGLFVPKTSAEVVEFSNYLDRKVGPIIAARRREVIYSFYPGLRPMSEIQGELF